MRELQLALVGYGYVGRVFHAPLITATPGLRLHSIVSRQPDVAGRHPGTRVSTDRAAVLGDPDIDAVVIATPNATHAPIALEALAAGKHVLVDKPFTLDLAQAQASLLAFDETGSHRAVQGAEALLAGRFDTQAPEVRAAHTQLQALSAARATTVAPQLGGALAQLRALRASHAMQAIAPAPATSVAHP